MRMTTSTSLISEPIFPKYTFSGKLEINNQHIVSLVNEVNQLNLYKYNWGKSGWNSDQNQVWNMTSNISKIVPLIARQLQEGLVNQNGWTEQGNHFISSQGTFKLETRRCYPVIILPGHDMPIQTRASYFTGITMLSCSETSHRPYIQNMNPGTNFEDQIKWWMPEVRQQIFIPGDVHWGISSGNDDFYTMALITHILKIRV